MQEFRKKQTIEVVKVVVKGDAIENQLPGQIAECDGYLVQNKGEDSDQWVIPTEVFKATYEPIGYADYTIITMEQRAIIRIALVNILIMKIKQVVAGRVTIEGGAVDCIKFMQNLNENFKTFEEKLEILNMCLKMDKGD